MPRPCINFSVDVEEWIHAEAVRELALGDARHRELPRVEANTDALLELLGRHGALGTFFVLGEVAERHPALVRRIAAAGHEVATHGHDHQLLWRQRPADFRRDLLRSKHAIEQLTGKPVLGFRAPKFSITDWGVDVLRECGFAYDSSFYACRSHARYPHLKERPQPERGIVRDFGNGLREITLSLLPVGGRYVPWSGGGFFRMIPGPLYRLGLRRSLRQEGGFTFFLHPWELDTGQPRCRGLGLGRRIKHYGWRRQVPARLERLLAEFATRPLAEAAAERALSAGTSPAPAAP